MAASHARQHLSFFLRTLGQVSCSAMSPDDSCWYGKPAPIVVGIEFERSRQQSKGWCCACVHWCQAALQPPGLVQNIQQWWEMAEDKGPYRVWRWEWGMQGSGRSVIPGDERLSHAAAPPSAMGPSHSGNLDSTCSSYPFYLGRANIEASKPCVDTRHT